MIYTTAKISPLWKVNKEDLKRWAQNMMVFTAPLFIVYLLQLNATLQNNGFLGKFDFIPNLATIGAIQLYLINTFLDLMRKFTDPTK